MRRIKKKIKQFLYKKVAPGYLETELFSFLPEQLPVFIDIGAHTGSFTKFLATRVKSDTRILVEPIPDYFLHLKEDSYFKDDYLINAAVSDKTGNAEFSINEMPQTSSLLPFDDQLEETGNINRKKEKSITVDLVTLADIIEQHNLKKVDFIKIDVQGAEMEVLKGLGDSLMCVDRILCEVSFKPLYKGSATFQEIYDFLSHRNFILLQLIPVYRGVKNELLQCDALFIRKDLHG